MKKAVLLPEQDCFLRILQILLIGVIALDGVEHVALEVGAHQLLRRLEVVVQNEPEDFVMLWRTDSRCTRAARAGGGAWRPLRRDRGSAHRRRRSCGTAWSASPIPRSPRRRAPGYRLRRSRAAPAVGRPAPGGRHPDGGRDDVRRGRRLRRGLYAGGAGGRHAPAPAA